MSQKSRSADVVQRVYDVIEEMLARFELKPSERLNEIELASKLDVSRTPVREALNRLSTIGLVTFVPNKGFFARGLEPEEMINLSELRAGVEGIAIMAACVKASDEAIAELASEWQSVVERWQTISASELTFADEAFHEKLVGLAENPELSAAARNINVRIRFFRQCAIEHPRRRNDTVSEHTEIVEALRERNSEKARALLEKHVSITAEDALDFISKGLAKIYLKQKATA